MSFTWFADAPLLSREQIARAVHSVSLQRGLDETATAIALITVATEVGADDADGARQWWCPANPAWPDTTKYAHDSISNDGRSCGYFQQQVGPEGQAWWGTTQSMMTLAPAADTFLARLTNNWQAAANNPELAGQFAYEVQDCDPDYAYRYAEHWGEAWDVLNRALAQPDHSQEPTVPKQPDYHEYPMWSPNNQGRNGTPIDLWLIHTEEGDGDADSLARYLDNPASQVSYHYTGSQDAHGRVTIVDVVDTDQASWSVLSANNRSINFCFAGSRAAWTRKQWLDNAGNVIDVAAWLAVQDCRKYGIEPKIMPHNHYGPPPGISDHYYVTKYLHVGTHTDVGDGFPWDVFAAAASKYAGLDQPKPPAKKGPLMALTDKQQHELLDDVRWLKAQLGPNLWGPASSLGTNAQGQELTVRDGLAAMRRGVDTLLASRTDTARKRAKKGQS